MPKCIISTTTGKLRSSAVNGGVMSFRGIPYAAAPIGALRWRPPAAAEPWSDVMDASRFGADAMQVAGLRQTRAKEMSEDCLFVNVWAPKEHRAGGWPVIVWSGGGAFSTGGGSFVEEDLENLARRGAVTVSFNYRLGIFGFLAHEALTAESSVSSSGNYGLMDHVAVLKWVRENIESFGGDSARVSYMAESSGAAAGLLLLTTPLEDKLFDQAIFLSPGSVTPLLPLEEAEVTGAPLGASVEELRALPADALLSKTKLLAAQASNLSVARPLRPIVDGWLITSDQAYTTGDFDPIPVIIGTNEDEGRFFTRRMAIDSISDHAGYLKRTFGDRAHKAARLYPAVDEEDVASAVAAAYGDVSINFPAERLLQAFAARQRRTYRFVYTYRHNATAEPPTHSEEAGTFLDNRAHLTPADQQMAQLVQSYLLAFANTGEPVSTTAPEWPRFDVAEQRFLKLDLVPEIGVNWRSEFMQFVCADTEGSKN